MTRLFEAVNHTLIWEHCIPLHHFLLQTSLHLVLLGQKLETKLGY